MQTENYLTSKGMVELVVDGADGGCILNRHGEVVLRIPPGTYWVPIEAAEGGNDDPDTIERLRQALNLPPHDRRQHDLSGARE